MGKTTTYCGAAASALMAALFALAMPATANAAQAATAHADAVANGAKLHLQWELQRPVAGAQLPKGTSPARFTLTNRDTHALPARGWSLYFNAIDRMPKGVQSGGLLLEQIAGGYFRLYPGPDFKGLAPGQTIDFNYQHSDSVYTSSKAPSGPYLVYDAAPDTGVALAYNVVPLAQPPQAAVAGSPHSLVTPQDTYKRNARAELLPAAAVPKVLPTPLQLDAGKGVLAIKGRPKVEAAPNLANEAALARSLFPASLPASGGPALRLSVGSVPGQASPEASV